jgi:hypothetical protein
MSAENPNAIDKIIAATSLHPEHQDDLGTFYVLLSAISAQNVSDTYPDEPLRELFEAREPIRSLPHAPIVRKLRKLLNDRVFTRQLGELPPEPQH